MHLKLFGIFYYFDAFFDQRPDGLLLIDHRPIISMLPMV